MTSPEGKMALRFPASMETHPVIYRVMFLYPGYHSNLGEKEKQSEKMDTLGFLLGTPISNLNILNFFFRVPFL